METNQLRLTFKLPCPRQYRGDMASAFPASPALNSVVAQLRQQYILGAKNEHGMPRQGRSSRATQRRYADAPAADVDFETTCANYRLIPDTGERYAFRSDALIFTRDAVPAFGWPTGPF